jgi:hypothetical protein
MGNFWWIEIQKLTELIEMDASCLLALKKTGHASWHDVQKWLLWHCSLAHVSLKAMAIVPMVVADALIRHRKCDCQSYIRCKLAPKSFTRNTTSYPTEAL